MPGNQSHRQSIASSIRSFVSIGLGLGEVRVDPLGNGLDESVRCFSVELNVAPLLFVLGESQQHSVDVPLN